MDKAKVAQHWQYNDREQIKDRVYTPVRGVTLNDGLFRRVFDNNRAFLKQFRMNDMLYWFDQKLGIQTDGAPYRGHFEDDLKGQTASQFLMGAGNALRWVEDEELRRGVEIILDKIEACAEPDGFMMPISQYEFTDNEYPHYTRIWLNYALTAAGLSGSERAYRLLRRWQDWFNACKDLPVIRHTNLAFQGIVASTYVYQTPVGIWDDVEIARKYYEEDWRLAQFMQKERDSIHIRRQPGYEPHPHGTEIESLEGYLDLYRATGAPYYLKAVLGARELYVQDWQHPGGGIVMCEFLEAFPGCGWIASRYAYNELCCTAFWVNLHQRLHRLFPDVEEYVSQIERSIYNVAIANQDGDRAIRYFAHLEGHKDPGGTVTCCCGVGTRLFGMLPEYLYSISDASLYVDIYAASSIAWERADGDVRLETVTDMPDGGKVELRLSMNEPHRFELALRIPSWAQGEVPVLLGDRLVGIGAPGSYLKLEREWTDGDVLRFELKMGFRSKLYTGKDQIPSFERYSFEYGPMLYAVTGAHNHFLNTRIEHRPERVSEWAVPSGDSLMFEIKGDPAHRLEPYYRLDERTEMTCFPIFAKPGENHP